MLMTSCAAPYGEAQPTVDAGGAYAAMTLTAAAAQQSALDAALARAAPTVTAQAAATQAALTAAADHATQLALTPTVAAQWTHNAQVLAEQQTLAARTAVAEALTATSQARDLYATGTAVALEQFQAARNATATWEVATATAVREKEQRERYRVLEDGQHLLGFVVILSLAMVAVAAAVVVLVIAAKALWRLLVRRPWIVRRDAGEPLPTLISDGRWLVHQADRQVYPTADTGRPDRPALGAQAQITSQAQAIEMARTASPSRKRRAIERMMANRQPAALPERTIEIIEVAPDRVQHWLSDVEDQLLLESGEEEE